MSPRAGIDFNKIIAQAAHIADEKGLDHVTIANLAKSFGIRPPSIYNHISGLAEVRQRLSIKGLNQLIETINTAITDLEAEDAIKAAGIAYVTFARAHPGLYDATVRAPEPGHEQLQQTSEALLNIIYRLFDIFHFENKEKIHAVRGFRSLLHGFTSLEQKEGFGLPISLNDTLTTIIETYINGLHSRSDKNE